MSEDIRAGKPTSPDARLHHAVGMADLFELMAAAFAFPTEELSDALRSGAFMSDWRASWRDATGEDWPGLAEGSPYPDASAFDDADWEPMRREYSRLYLLPGNRVPVWPYENCFLYREKGRPGTPGLFRSPTCIDVENQMKAAGVITVDARSVPADSIDKELAFESYLFGKSAEALSSLLESDAATADADAADADVWESRAFVFGNTHLANWVHRFAEQTNGLSRLQTYRTLAGLLSSAVGLLEGEDCGRKVPV